MFPVCSAVAMNDGTRARNSAVTAQTVKAVAPEAANNARIFTGTPGRYGFHEPFRCGSCRTRSQTAMMANKAMWRA